jgi:hypothetical protein
MSVVDLFQTAALVIFAVLIAAMFGALFRQNKALEDLESRVAALVRAPRTPYDNAPPVVQRASERPIRHKHTDIQGGDDDNAR